MPGIKLPLTGLPWRATRWTADEAQNEHTAPEAARVIARTLALTCADCTNGGGGSGGRSAHVPDHHLSGLG